MKRFLVALLATTSFAHASYYVECGNGDGADLDDTVFRASSGDEIFRGENGREWEVALAGDWLAAGKAKAKVLRDAEGNKNLQVIVVQRHGVTQIGHRYVVVGMYDDYPTLEVYNVGGFAGGVKTAQYECFTGIAK
jgi:hypothetical protein